jgi:hypothetical protein
MAVIIPYVNDIKHTYVINQNITNQNASEFRYADGVDSTVLAKFKNSTDRVLR